MRRLILCGFALAGGFALSCQILPATQQDFAAAHAAAALPDVGAGPPAASLAETLAMIEGNPHGDVGRREASIRRTRDLLDGRHTGLSRREIHAVATTIVDECARYGLEVGLVMAVIQVESGGYHRAVSPVGALGLMQIMPATGRDLARQHGVEWHGPATLFDPVVNVKLGIRYLSELSNRYDHFPTALAAYNWGPGRIDRRIDRGVGMPKLYVEQVMSAYARAQDDTPDGPRTGGASSS